MYPVRIIPSKCHYISGTASSHFWGCPSLPDGYEYPAYTDRKGKNYPYFFVCQINLEEFARFDREKLLPDKGLLSFFAKIDNYLGYYDTPADIGGSISGNDAVKVLYFPDIMSLKKISPEQFGYEFRSPEGLPFEFSTGSFSSYDEHMLFAPPSHRQWETWDTPFEEWKILLQIDSFEGDDFELNFMDTGVLDFLISPHELALHRFDNVRAIILSS